MRYLYILLEHLSPYAHAWRKLGTALKFQPQNLDNIQGCLPLMMCSPESYMQRLLEEWLERKYPHAAPPTLANLVEALKSHTVGLGRLAAQLNASLLQVEMFEIGSVSDEGFIISNKKKLLKVNEKTSVCLTLTVVAN